VTSHNPKAFARVSIVNNLCAGDGKVKTCICWLKATTNLLEVNKQVQHTAFGNTDNISVFKSESTLTF
jgi:hypothetical protein